jgi:hypothetical protein
MPAPKVVCTCLSFGCGNQELVNDFGQVQPGHYVASATRKNHEKRDEQMRLQKPSLQVSAAKHFLVWVEADITSSGKPYTSRAAEN